MSTPAADAQPNPSSDPPPSDAGAPPADLTPEQRAVNEVSNQLTAGVMNAGGGKKRKHDTNDDEDADVMASYKEYGRAYLRLGDPFTPIDDIVQHGIFIETTEEIDYLKMTLKERQVFDHKTASWEVLWRLIGPSFRNHMILLKKHKKLRHRVCAQIALGVSGSRGEDANTLKKCVLEYLNADTAVAVDPPISKTSKAERGYNHSVTAKLLCPAKKPPTDATYEAIANGTIKVTGRSFFRFYYPDNWVYDGKNLMDNLFEGHLMIRTAKCLLQGPSQALKPPGAHRGNRGNAAKIGARTVTPRLMAYIGVQTFFSISSLEGWQQTDGNFDYEQFYWTIVSLLEDEDNAHILQKFNHHVFGDASGRPAAPAPTAQDADDDDDDDLEAYRAAKKVRLAQPPSQSEPPSGVAA
ncbi:hypothetical protein R3P38DRAFT_3549618 [Favolaschia claudopus]|uniref:Uncharacterized protein n=1 Tax=Favolaschia claudopus TaxID=2862362 RepID=A0AAW0B4A2_9AGAR